MGHLKGLDASVKSSYRLLKPTVSSRIKTKGSEGHQLTVKQPAKEAKQLPKAQRKLPSSLPTQQLQQQQRVPDGSKVLPAIRTSSNSTAAGGSQDSNTGQAASHTLQCSSLQAAKLRLGLTAGLQVAEVGGWVGLDSMM